MEAAKPSEEIMLKLKDDETLYTLRFSIKSNALHIDITEEDSSHSIKYVSNFHLNDLKKNNKYFLKFNTLEELIPEIKNLCDENKIKLTKEKNIIIIKLTLPLKVVEEVYLSIPQAIYNGGFVLYNNLKEDLELVSANLEDENLLQYSMSPLEVFDEVILKSGSRLCHKESFGFLSPPPSSKQFIVRKVDIKIATNHEKLGDIVLVVWGGNSCYTCNKNDNSRGAFIRLKRPLRGGCPPFPFEIVAK
jgi:hypothetical protein